MISDCGLRISNFKIPYWLLTTGFLLYALYAMRFEKLPDVGDYLKII